MEGYQRKFVEEAKELLGSLESSLLELENVPDNQNIINEIFRIMHSLKGSGAMFGFSRISSLTHDLETVYSAIRSGQLIVSKFLIDISFNALDLIRELLKGVEGPEEMSQYTSLTDQIQSIFRQKVDTESSTQVPLHERSTLTSKAKKGETSIWLIHFSPHPDILSEGNNPIYMLDELATMGDMIAVPIIDNPEGGLAAFNPLKLDIRWNIILASDTSEESIYNVFLFVQEKSTIKLTRLTSAYSGEIKEKTVQLNNLLSEETIEVKNLQTLFIEDIDTKKSEATEDQSPKPTTFRSASEGEGDSLNIPESDDITIRVPSGKLDDLMNLVSELITAQGQLMTVSERIQNSTLNNLAEKYEKLVRQLREQAMEMSLVSINTLTVRFKRLVRDLSLKLDKEITLKVEGGETELDKTIIEHLSEPLLHIIRNAIDHGIETAENRKKMGKPALGEIKIRAYYSGSEVHIEIADDGKGIDYHKVTERALESNLIDNRSQLSENEILKLLFKPGFSMKEAVSEYSGRGVGMDVVAKKITELRGDVEISSRKGLGTKVLIKLPLTLTIMDGLLTEVCSTKYVVPISSVRKIYEIHLNELKKAFNNLVTLDGKQYPFLLLSNEFVGKEPEKDTLQLILVEYEDMRMGLVVDHILGERQVVLKPLGTSLKKNRMFSGGSIMGDGEIALVLDTNKLIKEFTTNRN